MLNFFPSPYPDELLYSVFARYHIRSGNISTKRTLDELFGNRNITAIVDMPVAINALVNRLPGFMKLTSEQLIINHTLYPYYTCFMCKERTNKILSEMKSNFGGKLHMSSGVMASSIHANVNFYYCNKCHESDYDKYGECYWHRLHQTPGILICTEHDELLQDSGITIHGSNKHEYIQATCPSINEQPYKRCVSINDKWKYLGIARDIQWVLNNFHDMRQIDDYREEYINLLKYKGLATKSGRVYQQEFVNSFIGYYGEEFLKDMQSAVNTESEDNWLSSIVRKHRKAFHPIRHLLVIGYLCGSVEKLIINANKVNNENVNKNFARRNIGNLESKQKEKTLYNCKTEVEERSRYRSRWSELIKQNSLLSKTEIRNLDKGCYTWLYRHDNKWLNNNSPSLRQPKASKVRVNWEDRDTDILNKVKEAVNSILVRQKPERITMGKIGKEIGMLGILQKHIDKIPLTKDYLHQANESIEDFQIRRIKFIANQLREDGADIKEWIIKKKAGLDECSEIVKKAIELEVIR